MVYYCTSEKEKLNLIIYFHSGKLLLQSILLDFTWEKLIADMRCRKFHNFDGKEAYVNVCYVVVFIFNLDDSVWFLFEIFQIFQESFKSFIPCNVLLFQFFGKNFSWPKWFSKHWNDFEDPLWMTVVCVYGLLILPRAIILFRFLFPTFP